MRIEYLERDEIDADRWNEAVAASCNAFPYAYSWYLDAAAGGRWSALVSPDHQLVFPLPWNRKRLFFRQVYQPFFTQQLGLFGPKAEQIHDALPFFLEALSGRFKRVALHLNEQNPVGDDWPYRRERRMNFVVPLDRHHPEIFSNYGRSLRKNLRRARKAGLALKSGQEIELLIRIYQKEVGYKVPELRRSHYLGIGRIIRHAMKRGQGQLYAVEDADGQMLAAGFFLVCDRRVVNLFGASTLRGKSEYAMHFMLDELIRKFAGSSRVFDFEGSSIPSIAAFFRSFGASEAPFFRIIR